MIARAKVRVRPQASYGNITVLSHLKLFLDIVPSSSAEITRALRGCFCEGSVYMSFRIVSFQSKAKPPTLLTCLL